MPVETGPDGVAADVEGPPGAVGVIQDPRRRCRAGRRGDPRTAPPVVRTVDLAPPIRLVVDPVKKGLLGVGAVGDVGDADVAEVVGGVASKRRPIRPRRGSRPLRPRRGPCRGSNSLRPRACRRIRPPPRAGRRGCPSRPSPPKRPPASRCRSPRRGSRRDRGRRGTRWRPSSPRSPWPNSGRRRRRRISGKIGRRPSRSSRGNSPPRRPAPRLGV